MLGSFTGKMQLDDHTTLDAQGISGIYLVALAPDGDIRWAKSFGAKGDDQGLDLVVGPDGHLYVTGHFDGTITIGSAALTAASPGAHDLLLASLETTGKPRWAARHGGAGGDQGRGVAVDPQGNVYVVGGVDGTNTKPEGAVLVASFAQGGSPRWEKSCSATGSRFMSVVADGTGVYAAGGFEGSLDLGGGPLVSQDGDVFLVSLTPGGTLRWNKRFGGKYDDAASGLAIGPRGHLDVVGGFTRTVDLGGGPFKTSTAGMFLASFDTAGGHRWSEAFETGYAFGPFAVAAAENVYVTGRLAIPVDLGGGVLVPKKTAPPDGFIASFTSTGSHRWSALSTGGDLAVGAAGVYVAGGDAGKTTQLQLLAP